MKRLKGYSFKLGNQELVLREPFSNTQPSFDCIFFSTNVDGQLCKVLELETEASQLKFQRERNVLQLLSSQPFVTYTNSHEFVYKKNRYGVLIFENVRKGSLLCDEMETLKEKDIIAVSRNILKVLETLHSRNLTLLAVKPDAFTSSVDQSFCIPIQYSLLIDKTLDQNGLGNSLIHRQFLDNSFKYKSPQLLNSFSKEPIDWRSDIFAFGCLLYELAYKSYPFETPLAVINLSFSNLDEPKFNQKLANQLLKQCLTQYSKRSSATTLLSLLNQQPSTTLSAENKENKRSIFDQFKNAITIMTTQSQKWIVKYIQANGKVPDEDMVTQLLTKVYKNNGKLQKIYSLIHKYTLENMSIKSVESVTKVLCLLWNFIRRGPPAVLDDYPQNITTIIKATEKLKSQNIIQQVGIILALKMIIADEFKHILQGNFGLLKLQAIKEINANTLISLVDYLKNVVQTYRKLVNPAPYICSLFFDQMYDLSCSLVLLYLSITKDIQKQRRKPQEKLQIIEKELNKTLEAISKLPRAQLHLIASLDTLENYKHFFEFEAVENVKVSAFELFYKTDVVYHNLKLPVSFKSMSKGQQVILDNEDDEDQDYEGKPQRHIDGLIGRKENKEKEKEVATGTGSTQPEKPKPKINDFDVEWGKKPKQPTNGFHNVFGNQLSKSTFADLQFPQKPKQQKQKSLFGEFPAPRPREKSMIQSFLYPETVAKKAQSNIDLFDFDFPTRKVEEKPGKSPIATSAMNFDFLNPAKISSRESIKAQVKREPSPSSLMLEQFVTSLKDQNLKSLVRGANIVVDFKSLSLNKVIGCGNAGEVYQGSLDNKTVAIKKIKSRQQNPNAHKQFQREITTLITIGKHLRLNSLIGLSKQESDYYLLMDYCAGGNLFQLLHRRMDLTIPWKVRANIARQIAEGMNYLHSNCKIIHRDLKSLNILVANKYITGEKVQQNILVKITDFGLARNPDEFMTNALGTLHWMAPELLEDVYSFGVVLWELCCRQTPYQQFKSPHLIIKHVALNGGRPDLKALNQGCPQELKQLMIKCWSTNPSFRPNFDAIVQILSKMQI